MYNFATIDIVMIISVFPEVEDGLLMALSGTFKEAPIDTFTHCLVVDCKIVRFVPFSEMLKSEHDVHLKIDKKVLFLLPGERPESWLENNGCH